MRLDGNLTNEAALEGGKSGWRGEGPMCRLIAKHTHKHRQRSHSQPHHLILSQTGGKMLYFPSKLKCHLILMWKRRVPSAQCTDTQTAFTLTDTSLEFQIPPWPAAVSWWSHAHGSRRDVWVWSGPMSRLIPSVSWRLFLNLDAVVGGCCLKKQKSAFTEMEVNLYGLGKSNHFVPQMTAGVSLFVLLYLVGLNGNSGTEG